MRTEAEIQRTAKELAAMLGQFNGKGDNFRYGLLIGKVMALAWSLGEPAEMSRHYNLEEWINEQRSKRGAAPVAMTVAKIMTVRELLALIKSDHELRQDMKLVLGASWDHQPDRQVRIEFPANRQGQYRDATFHWNDVFE
ncbi:MAG: hypothetical protein SH868_03255 [Bythopirellula sp.]|nr:hypothetical protein [Bythopirellula sp.]